MSLKQIRSLALLLLVPICGLLGSLRPAYAQQKEQKNNGPHLPKTACANEDRAKFSVRCKDRYFLGEIPSVTISITNTGHSPMNTKEAEYQKFAMERTVSFQSDSEQTKKLTYDGSWNFPKASAKNPGPGELQIWPAATKREAKYVLLQPGQSTNLELDLAKTFGSYLRVGKYKLIVKSEEGEKVVKEFEVYFDDEKSVPILAKMLASDSDDVTERHWALFNLAQFSRPKLIALLEQLVKTGNEKQRDFASGILARIKAGNFGPDPGLKTKQSGK